MSNLTITDKQVVKWLWIFTALIFPLFAVDFARINLGLMHLALPNLSILIIALFGSFMFAMKNKWLHRSMIHKTDKSLLLLLSLFLALHLLSLALMTENFNLGRKEAVKLAIDYVCFWTVLFLFPREEKFFELFWVLVFWATVPLLMFLIYKYVFVFHSMILGININAEDKHGKNLLTWYLTIVSLYAIFHFWHTQKKWFFGLSLGVISLSVIYAQSRSAWVSIFAGFLYGAFVLFRVNRRAAVRMILVISVSLLMMGAVGLSFLEKHISLVEMSARLVSLYDPESLPEEFSNAGKHSYDDRLGIIMQAFPGIKEAPIMGIGLADSETFIGTMTHNNYVGILLELGVIGLLLYLAILFKVYKKTTVPLKSKSMKWYSLGTRTVVVAYVVSLIFTNSYTMPLAWIFLALFLVSADIERPFLQATNPNAIRSKYP